MVAEESRSGAAGLHVVSPDGPLYRIARPPDPWSWPNWANIGPDGTLGNRWDDPEAVYRVLYASSSPLGALMEVLARFRPDPHILSAFKEIEVEGSSSFPLPGDLDPSWVENRCLGVAEVDGEFVDVGHSRSLATLREALTSRIVHYGLDDLDAAAVRLSAPRRFTQEISRYVYDQSTSEGRRRFAGIAYRSRLGDEFQNWAIFESLDDPSWAVGPETQPLEADDPDLIQALKRLGVRLHRDRKT